jgi:lipopolysaccharide biosynthesis protein
LQYYTTAWRKGFHCRKPFPGFHPGIYADHHPGISRDPLAHFLACSRPSGPWLSEVIQSGSNPKVGEPVVSSKAALHIHLHYPEVAGEIFSRLKSSRMHPDLFISVTSDQARADVLSQIDMTGLRNHVVRIVPNRGRDIGPLFTGFPELFSSGYEIIGHVHGKKSVKLGADFAHEWAAFMYENLLGGKAPMMDVILGKMQADPSIGIVFPDDPHVVGWEANWSFARELGDRMGVRESLRAGSINFPVGTMFWARTRALEPFLKLNLQWENYPEEPLPYDGSMLHAMERLFPQVSESQGLRVAVTHVKGVTR